MPLLDHFHPPLKGRRHWQGFHSRWASSIADSINLKGLPADQFAEPMVNLGGQAQVDVATLEEPETSSNGSVATLPQVAIEAPTWVIPAVFPKSFEVQVFSTDAGPTLIAAIELISPANKDRPETRRAFAAKCASYLHQGIHVIIIDIVTDRSANLHNEIMELMQRDDFRMSASDGLYAVAYRPVLRNKREEIDAWPASFAVGGVLPTLPLYVAPDYAVLVDFEESYQETCQKLRLAV